MKIFVYGTLRTGGRFSNLLPENKKTSIYTIHGLRMYNLLVVDFPGVIKTNNSKDYVVGELQEYDLTAIEENALLSLLDQVECVDQGLFKRSIITLSTGDKVWIYEFNRFDEVKYRLKMEGKSPKIVHDWATVDHSICTTIDK